MYAPMPNEISLRPFLWGLGMVLNSKSQNVGNNETQVHHDMDTGTSNEIGQNNEDIKNQKFGASNGKLKRGTGGLQEESWTLRVYSCGNHHFGVSRIYNENVSRQISTNFFQRNLMIQFIETLAVFCVDTTWMLCSSLRMFIPSKYKRWQIINSNSLLMICQFL